MRKRFHSRSMLLALLFSVFTILVLIGCRGTAGSAGAPGISGSDGGTGSQGALGAQGAQGIQGSQGVPGLPGSAGSSGPPGPPGPAGPDGSAAVSSAASIAVSSAQLTLDEPITIWGAGFLPGEPIVLTLAIAETTDIIIGGGACSQVSANNSGAFSMTFDAIGGKGAARDGAPGTRTISATGRDGSLATAPVVIVTASSPAPSPSTSLVAGAVDTGGTTTIWGAGFKAQESVSIVAVGVAGRDTLIVGGVANSFGALMVDAEINLDIGVYTLKAVGSMGSEATAPLVVVEAK
jgi:hypothetical protein